jgi:WD40 repeat protein
LHDLQFDYVRKQAGDLPALHSRFLRAYARKCPADWHTGPDDGYFFGHLGYHLLSAGLEDELRELLLDYRWVLGKLEAADVNSLISDYSLLPDDADLRLIQGAIRLSAHVLSRDAAQLAGQITGRLLPHDSPGIRTLLGGVREHESIPWLWPLTPGLIPAGGPMLRTLGGHTWGVTSVCVTPDGRRAISGSDDHTLKVWELETGEVIATFTADGALYACAVAPDGVTTVAAGASDRVHFLRLEGG